MIQLSIILVHYKTQRLLLDCLQSIYQYDTSVIEIIVVDNASEDDTQQVLLQQFPQVQWLQMGYNSGFARANNAGIMAASGDIVLLLNTDTVNINNAINTCYQQLKNGRCIAAGVQLLNGDGSPQISGNYFMAGGLNHLMALPVLGAGIRWIGLKIGVKKTNVKEAAPIVLVDWINGAFLMVKKTAIEKAGLLDEDFFLYSEEIEWCSRLYKVGKLCIYGDLHVLHLEGGSAKAAFESNNAGYQVWYDKKGYQLMLSHFVRIRKQFGVGWYMVHLLANICTIPVYFVVTAWRSIFCSKAPRVQWAQWFGYAGNVLKTLAYMPSIILKKEKFYKVL